MQNYKNSDYALNKFSEGIVYRFADGIVEVKLADYLAENPGKTEADFLKLKKLSDDIYLIQVRDENAQTKHNSLYDELINTTFSVQSPEESLINVIDAQEKYEFFKQRLTVSKNVLSKLTDVQRKRYLLHVIGGLTTRKIAEMEGVSQRTVMDSLEYVEKK